MRVFFAPKIHQWDFLIRGLLDDTERPNGDKYLLKKTSKEVLDILSGLISQFEKLGWKEAFGRAVELRCLFDVKLQKANNIKRSTAQNIQDALFELRRAITEELHRRKFTMIENSKAGFLEQKNLFGKSVWKAFPSARDEIQAAGNCLALDLNTAAVFHLMRAAELGMRALAVHLKVRLCEGMGIRAVSRLTGLDKKTVLRILVSAGEHCAAVLDERVRNVKTEEIQADELHTFVTCKAAQTTADDMDRGIFSPIWRSRATPS